jgi:hypothetical protein
MFGSVKALGLRPSHFLWLGWLLAKQASSSAILETERDRLTSEGSISRNGPTRCERS